MNDRAADLEINHRASPGTHDRGGLEEGVINENAQEEHADRPDPDNAGDDPLVEVVTALGLLTFVLLASRFLIRSGITLDR